MADAPHVGLAEVDRLIQLAMERAYKFPAGVKRWQLLAWAAEALDAKRTDPQTYERTELERITEAHFPRSTKTPPT
jgi:hypothetical protein